MYPIIGHSVALIPGDNAISSAFTMIDDLGGNAIQISFGDLTKLDSFHVISKKDITNTRKILTKRGKYLVVHGKFIYNFCLKNNIIHQNSLLRELLLASKLQDDVVIHHGNNINNLEYNEAREHFTSNVRIVVDSMKKLGLVNKILLENSARQENEIGYSLKELGSIWQSFSFSERQSIGFCIDACHLFASGELNVSDPKAVKEWFRKFDNTIGRDNLKLVHLNDSNSGFNSFMDEHAEINRGLISKEGLAEVVKICNSWQIPMINVSQCQYEHFRHIIVS